MLETTLELEIEGVSLPSDSSWVTSSRIQDVLCVTANQETCLDFLTEYWEGTIRNWTCKSFNSQGCTNSGEWSWSMYVRMLGELGGQTAVRLEESGRDSGIGGLRVVLKTLQKS